MLDTESFILHLHLHLQVILCYYCTEKDHLSLYDF